MRVANGRVITPEGVLPDGHVEIDDGLITAVGPGGEPDVDAASGWIVPGFVDLQFNGWAGADLTQHPERIDDLAALLPQYGVTSFLPTIVTCPLELRDNALAAWRRRAGDRPGAAAAIGLHLEGPMLNPARRGAHPEAMLALPSSQLVAGWSGDAGVTMVTLAPELPGAVEAVRALVERGVVVSLGHTDATAAQLAAGLAAGATYVTHLFNGMRPFGHRDPGPIGAVLADDAVVAGLICDGIHVDPVAVRVAWRSLGPQRLNLVTDAVATAAGPSGVRTADGVLAGSDLTLDQAVRNLVAWTGCAVEEAIATVTSTPAAVLGLADRGRLAVGCRGDVTVLDPELRVVTTLVAGVRSDDARPTSRHGP